MTLEEVLRTKDSRGEAKLKVNLNDYLVRIGLFSRLIEATITEVEAYTTKRALVAESAQAQRCLRVEQRGRHSREGSTVLWHRYSRVCRWRFRAQGGRSSRDRHSIEKEKEAQFEHAEAILFVVVG